MQLFWIIPKDVLKLEANLLTIYSITHYFFVARQISNYDLDLWLFQSVLYLAR